MTESQADNAAGTWEAPQCPFAIGYSKRVLDDIRLAVMDAFFSLPRGGAEIGGVLLGRFAAGRVTVSDYQGLDCEHAFGPSFTLSPRDEAKLEELLVAQRPGVVPVGWYHSHTRSEIFLSEADLAIHKRFFPEPWQVALVMKPHTFQPLRCGFFFREHNGNIQAGSSCQEFTLDPLPMRPVPSGGVPLLDDSATPPGRELENNGKVITVAAGVVADGAAAADTASALEANQPKPERKDGERTRAPIPPAQATSRRGLKILLTAVFCAAVAIAGFETRQLWWPRISALLTPSANVAPAFAPIGLSTIDVDGQLQIRWDRQSSAIRDAVSGRLSITDVSPLPREIELDPIRLQAGNFTYVREGDSVTVVLALEEPNGRQAHEVSTFLGKLPAPKPAGRDNPELRRQRDAAVQEVQRLRQEVAAQADRLRKLQKALDEQARRRQAAQVPK